MKHRMVSLILVVLLATGCVKDPYRASMQGSADVSQAVSSAIKLTGDYYATGKFSDGQKAVAAQYFTVVTDCNMAFRKTITDVHNSGATGVQAFLPVADTFVQCVQTSAPISADPKVENVLIAVDTAIKGVATAVSSAKGGTTK